MQSVKIDHRGRANDHAVSVKKSTNENVTWTALGNGGPWKLTFDKDALGSPFNEADYLLPQGGAVSTSGGPMNGAVGNTYRYNVRNGNTNAITDDPDIDIE